MLTGARRGPPLACVVRAARLETYSIVLRARANDPETAEDLHGSCGDLIALHIRRFTGMPDLGDGHVNAARRKVHGEGEPDRPSPDDQHAGFNRATIVPLGLQRCYDHMILPRVSSSLVGTLCPAVSLINLKS